MDIAPLLGNVHATWDIISYQNLEFVSLSVKVAVLMETAALPTHVPVLKVINSQSAIDHACQSATQRV